MPLTPEDVRNKQFTTVRLREGYDEDEVDAFLDEVETELRRLIRENDELRAKLAAATRAASAAPAASTTAPQPVVVKEPEPAPEPRSLRRPRRRPLRWSSSSRPQSVFRQRGPRSRAGSADRRPGDRRGPHRGQQDRRRRASARRGDRARGAVQGRRPGARRAGQAPLDHRRPGDPAHRAGDPARPAPPVRARVPQPPEVLPGGAAASAGEQRRGGEPLQRPAFDGSPARGHHAAPADAWLSDRRGRELITLD